MSRGGKRERAGRKAVLTFEEQLIVGRRCEQMQSGEIAFAEALREFNKSPDAKRIRKTQKKALAKRKVGEKDWVYVLPLAERLNYLKKYVAPDLDGIGRVISPDAPDSREFTRAQIHKRVSDWCPTQGFKGVSPRRVEASWKVYRQFKRELEGYTPDLNNSVAFADKAHDD